MSLLNGLIEHWSVDNTLNGSLGAINLTAVGTAFPYVTGVRGQALQAPGVSGRFKQFNYNSALAAGTIAFSYKSTGDGTGGFHRIFGKTQVSVTDVLNIGFANFGRQPVLVLSDDVIYQPNTDVFTRNVNYNHVITWNGSNIIWYVDGVVLNNTAGAQGLDANTTPITLCGWSGNTTQQSQGEMDHMAMWSRALSASEVTIWNNGGALLPFPFSPARLLMMGVG